MEYLEMRGAVTLRVEADKTIVHYVLSKLRETEFIDGGYIDIHSEGRLLSIYAEGTIVESDSLRVLLRKLQDQLTESSSISVSSVRWETFVILKHREPILAKRRQAYDQLVLAQ